MSTQAIITIDGLEGSPEEMARQIADKLNRVASVLLQNYDANAAQREASKKVFGPATVHVSLPYAGQAAIQWDRSLVIRQINHAITLIQRDLADVQRDNDQDLIDLYQGDLKDWQAILKLAQDGATGQQIRKAIDDLDTGSRDNFWSDLSTLDLCALEDFLEYQ